MEDTTDAPPLAEDRIDDGEAADAAPVAEEAMDATEDNDGNGPVATAVEDEADVVEEAERPPPRLMITKMVRVITTIILAHLCIPLYLVSLGIRLTVARLALRSLL